MKELICIVCPKGCHLKVDEEHDYAVTGNSCPRGAEYGRNEILHPVRVITSVVRMEGEKSCCPVKTDGGIPKGKIFEAMEELKPVRVSRPIHIGDVVVKDVCGTDVNWTATKNFL